MNTLLADVQAALRVKEAEQDAKGWDENPPEVFGIFRVIGGGDLEGRILLGELPIPAPLRQGGAGVSQFFRAFAEHLHETDQKSRGLPFLFTDEDAAELEDKGGDLQPVGFGMTMEAWALESSKRQKGRPNADTPDAQEVRMALGVLADGEILRVHRFRGKDVDEQRTHIAYDRAGMTIALWELVGAAGFSAGMSMPDPDEHPDMIEHLKQRSGEG